VGLAALFLSWPLYRVFLPLEVYTNEPWNAWQIARAMGSGSLYPPPGDLIANNYPPLYFYLVGLLSSLSGDVIVTGRLTSLVAVFALTLTVACCLRQLGASRAASAFAAAWLLATLARHYEVFVGMNDPHLPALAIMIGGLVWFLALHRNGRATEPSLAVMVLAGFVKHSLWAVPATALLWILLHDRWRGLRGIFFMLVLAMVGVIFCIALWGIDFVLNLLAPRLVTLHRGLVTLGRLQMIAPALFIWGLWCHARRDCPSARFSALFVALAFFTCTMQSMGQGVTINALFELVVATAIGLGLAVQDIAAVPLARRLGIDRARNWLVLLLVVRLMASTHFEPFQILASPKYRLEIADQVAVTEAEIARVRALPDPVVCTIGTVCFRAGRKFVYDEFLLRQRVVSGAWSPARLKAAIDDRGLRFETVDPRAEWSSDLPTIFHFFSNR
jgi:hypothetical protein